jgi:outer membrane protein TolC
LALPPGAQVEPADANLVQLQMGEFDEARLNALARQHRPELAALKEGQAAYTSLAEAEDAGDLPDFFATVFATGAYTPGRDLVDTRYAVDPLNHFVPGALVGARWQFDGGMANHRASENQAKAEELAHLERWASGGIPAEVRVAIEDIRRAQLDIDSTEVAVKRAKKWAVQAAADFSFGLGASSEVEDSTSTYVQLRLALLRARYNYNVSLASLAKATGTLTSPTGGVYPPSQ